MTGEDFRAFLDRMGWQNQMAAEKLGVGRNTITRYLANGGDASLDYACAALAFGLPKWSEGHGDHVAVSRADLERLAEMASRLAKPD